MKTVLDLIKRAGGWHPGLYLKIDNPPYMELVIEAMDESVPCGLPATEAIANKVRQEFTTKDRAKKAPQPATKTAKKAA